MNIVFNTIALPSTGALVVGAMEGGVLCKSALEADRKSRGALSRAIRSSRFKGKLEQSLELLAPPGLSASRILLVGFGKPAVLSVQAAEKIGALIVSKLSHSGDKLASAAIDPMEKCPLSTEVITAHMACGARLGAYRFDKFRTKIKPEDKPSLGKLNFMCAKAAAARLAFAPLEAVIAGVNAARDLVNEPANTLTPAEIAKRAKALVRPGLTVEVLDEAQMGKLGMGSLLAVGQGSAQESRLVILNWRGAPKSKQPPVVILGKGVCFDSGGISLKPGAGMGDMKGDMGGAAAVFGAMMALAGRGAKANVTGILGCVENMPGPEAQRPGDIVTSMSGQTIEVLNTDAEGRLVLADVLTYAQRIYKPRALIDLATLTGAIIMALSDSYAGLFSNNDALAAQVTAAGEASGEKVWRMPMGGAYDKKLKSKFADMQNIASAPSAGAITAAQFLLRFVENNTPWAHIDIAGVAWSGEAKPSWGTGYGVRLIDRLIADNFEA